MTSRGKGLALCLVFVSAVFVYSMGGTGSAGLNRAASTDPCQLLRPRDITHVFGGRVEIWHPGTDHKTQCSWVRPRGAGLTQFMLTVGVEQLPKKTIRRALQYERSRPHASPVPHLGDDAVYQPPESDRRLDQVSGDQGTTARVVAAKSGEIVMVRITGELKAPRKNQLVELVRKMLRRL